MARTYRATAGAALLGLGDWRLIYTALVAISLILLLVMLLLFNESARIDPTTRLMPSVVVGNYLDQNHAYHGFIDNNGQITTVDVPGSVHAYGAGTDVVGINNLGEAVGWYYDGLMAG